MASTDRGVQLWGKKLQEKNLGTTRSKEFGKGLEYSRASLPAETREYLQDQDRKAILQALPPELLAGPDAVTSHAVAVATRREVTRPAARIELAEATTAARNQATARQIVLRTLRSLQETEACSRKKAAHILLQHARSGQLAPVLVDKLRQAHDVRGHGAGRGGDLPSTRTLQRWATAREEGSALVPRPSMVVDLTVRNWYAPFFALMDRPQKPTMRWAHEKLLQNWQPEWADTPGAPPPSYHSLVLAYRKRSRLDVAKGQNTGSALRAKLHYVKRTYAGMEPFIEVHADGWNTHFTAPHPVTGAFVTYEIWHFHDVATRFVTPMAIGLSENTDVILKGLRNCITVGGQICIWQTDHTSSVKNKRVLEEHSGLADRLGFTVVHPQTVGNSNANGIAENFNTWLDRESRELATYQHPDRMDSGTFVRVRRITNAMVRAASNPQDRAKLRTQAMKLGKGIVFDSYQEAVRWITALETKWNNHQHRELPKVRCEHTGRMVHMTPQQSLDAARKAGWEPLLLEEATLAEAFRPHLRKKITRGTVTPYGGMRYHHPELAHLEGEEVLVAVDPDDKASVWVKTLAGERIVKALFDEAVGPRSESLNENSKLKRANARIRLREAQIDEIEREVADPALEMQSAEQAALIRAPFMPATADYDADERPMSFAESMTKLAALEAAAGGRIRPHADEDEIPLKVAVG